MNVICIQEQAFYDLIDRVIDHVEARCLSKEKQSKWIDDKKAMKLLNIKSKTTLQKLRDEGKIRFSKPQPRIVLYDRDSVFVYLEKCVKEIF